MTERLVGILISLGVVLGCVVWTLLALNAAQSPNLVSAHEQLDQVQVSRFISTWNDWRTHHPRDTEGVLGSHWHSVDVGDLRRGRKTMDAFHEIESVMKDAGY